MKEEKQCDGCSHYWWISDYGAVGACGCKESKMDYVKGSEFCCYWQDKFPIYVAPIESRFEILDL